MVSVFIGGFRGGGRRLLAVWSPCEDFPPLVRSVMVFQANSGCAGEIALRAPVCKIRVPGRFAVRPAFEAPVVIDSYREYL